jgi:hypothetical protein
MHARKLAMLLVTAGAIAALIPASASAWAPAATAPIHPGVQTVTAGGQCTSNFVFQDASGTYLGQAAHCSSTGGQTSTDGCDTGSQPIGTAVEIDGASKPGTLAYNSWLTMQQKNETDADTCAYNDLALVKIDPADVANVNPTVPGFGGPTGLGSSTAATATGDDVYSYGNSSLRFGVTKLSPKKGKVVQSEGNGWSRNVVTLSPGIPGDSGSGFMDGSGQAIGVLSTLQIAPFAGTNGVGDLSNEVNYMHANSSFSGTSLVPGTEPFSSDWVSAIGNA